MSLFRSEDHIATWLDGRQSGATLTVSHLNSLAQAWWSDRLAPDWRSHTREHNQAILDGLGLTGEFWRLP
jgi:hypothetical protein